MIRVPVGRVDDEPSLRPCLSLFVRLAHHGRETVVLLGRNRKPEVTEPLEELPHKHPRGTVYVAWGNHTREGEKVRAILPKARGRLLLLPIETCHNQTEGVAVEFGMAWISTR